MSLEASASSDFLNWSALVAIFIFVLTQLISLSNYLYRSRKSRRNTAINLYMEATHNLKQIELFLRDEKAEQKLLDFVSNEERKVPLWIFITQEMIFRNLLSDVLKLKSEVVIPTLELYNSLEKIKALINSFESKGFSSISIQGRRQIICDIIRFEREAAIQCKDLIVALEAQYGVGTFDPIRFPYPRMRSNVRRQWTRSHVMKLPIINNMVIVYHRSTNGNHDARMRRPWIKG